MRTRTGYDADYAIVVVLDLAVQPFAAFEDNGAGRFDDGRALVANVAGRRMLECRLPDRVSAEKLAKTVQVNLFAYIELQKGVDGAREDGRFGGGLGDIRHPVEENSTDYPLKG
jgi:hypothetical protein